MIPVQTARDMVLAQIPVLGAERLDLLSSLGRILAEDVSAPFDVPPHDNSAMDGYAVRAQDTTGAAPTQPVVLEVIGDVAAGYVSQLSLDAGQSIRIMTGAPLPDGADAVVRVEDTRRGEGPQVIILHAVPPHYDVRRAGEDFPRGQTLLRKGTRLRPAEIGVLASVGRSCLAVYQRPQVAILATGDELVEIDEPLTPGKIMNSNSYALAALVAEAGGIPLRLGIARDTRADLEAKFTQATRADIIISSGGVSVGDFDFVKDMLQRDGSEMQFWSVCMKPGKPFAFGRIGGKPLFGLPGNPVSAMVSFEIFVRPALLRMMGHAHLYRAIVNATLTEDFHKHDERKHFVRVRLTRQDDQYRATLTGAQGSGILSSMSKANGLAIIDEDRLVVPAGANVPVMLLDGVSAMSAARPF